MSAAIREKISVLLFRNDLRLHDHEPLVEALQHSRKTKSKILPLYCFDPRFFKKTYFFSLPRWSPLKCQFLIESVSDLRQSLKRLGSDLVVRVGRPEDIIKSMQTEGMDIDALFLHKDVAFEEVGVEAALRSVCSSGAIQYRPYWGGLTLYHLDDLPFPTKGRGSDVLDVFTQFRKSVESGPKPVRPVLKAPTEIGALPPNISSGDVPSVEDLLKLGENEEYWRANQHIFSLPVGVDASKVNRFQGGETAGLAHVRDYIWRRELIKSYKDTRNGLLGMDYSSKFSVWLANGCISPRYIYEEILKYEKERVANDSTYWLFFELLWRDFFKFLTLKHGSRIFQLNGLKLNRGGYKEQAKQWKTDDAIFQRWKNGLTGYSFVDANMRELSATGFMSNRGRQNVASFLTKDLHLDWRLGAEYFESVLLDHDPCSNYGNWLYVAGVGTDPREDRYFNVVKQGAMYDPKGEFVEFWFPKLKRLASTDLKHRPFLLNGQQQELHCIRVGIEWPEPICQVKYSPKETGQSRHNQLQQTQQKAWKVHRPGKAATPGGWSRMK